MKKVTLTLVFIITLLFLLKDPGSNQSIKQGELVAYRGGGQLLDYASMDNFSCAASNLLPSENKFIENTIESVGNAISKEFNIIHLNIHKTKDNDFAVFHDWKLECATNGSGKTSSYTMDKLRSLDAGYGYTFDKDNSYPWRGKGIKVMSVRDIIKTYPEKIYWLNLKTADDNSVEILNEYLKTLPLKNRNDVVFISSKIAAEQFKALNPNQVAVSVESTKSCFIDYMLYGWSRFFPESCKIPPCLFLLPKHTICGGGQINLRVECIARVPKSIFGLSTQHSKKSMS